LETDLFRVTIPQQGVAPLRGGKRPDRAGCIAFRQGLAQIAGMKYLHTMVRVTDIEQSLRFYRDALGLVEISRKDYPQGRYTLVFLAASVDSAAQVELTHNWDPEAYAGGRNFGHLAYSVDNIYATCQRLRDHGVTINRPPRDGRMAFVRSPDNISIELLQQGGALAPAEPWLSMGNTGVW
jgi:lactoylglutathione lyase